MKNPTSFIRNIAHTGAWQVIVSRLAVMASGLGIAMIAPTMLKPVEQGYFFTFLSLASLQGLFELGITALLIQHFAHLKGDILKSSGQDSVAYVDEAVAIHTFAENYFKRAGLLFAAFVGAGGILFFWYSQGLRNANIWLAPWLLVTIATSMSLYNLSGFSAVEGYGSLKTSYRIRTESVVVLFATFCVAMFLSAGLFAQPLAFLLSQIFCAVKLNRERNILHLRRRPGERAESVRVTGLRSNQGKFAVSAVAGFFTANSITPYAFHIFGPIVAGQVGLSVTMFTAAASLAMAFSTADAPLYGQLLAQGRFRDVMAAWRKNISYSLICASGMASVLLLLNVLLAELFPKYSLKILGWHAFLWLGIMIVVNTSLTTISSVLRAFRTEVLMWPSIIGALVSIWLQFGAKVAPDYYFLGMAVYNGAIFLPYAGYLMWKRLGPQVAQTVVS